MTLYTPVFSPYVAVSGARTDGRNLALPQLLYPLSQARTRCRVRARVVLVTIH
jgi:hypothetical protein